MKYAFAASAVIGAVMAQSLNDLPPCGQTCIGNMLGLAGSLGCPPVNGQPDAACLCGNVNFGYGIRDCVAAACTGGENTGSILAYGVAYCGAVAGQGNSASQQAATSVLAGAGASATGSGNTPAPSAVSTEAVVTTITTDGSTITSTIGSTTIFAGAAGATGSAISTEAILTTITTDGSTITSTIGSTTIFASGSGASASASSAASDASSSASDAASSLSEGASSTASEASASASDALSSASSAAESATSTGAAPMITAAAHGLAGVAGLAAILML